MFLYFANQPTLGKRVRGVHAVNKHGGNERVIQRSFIALRINRRDEYGTFRTFLNGPEDFHWCGVRRESGSSKVCTDHGIAADKCHGKRIKNTKTKQVLGMRRIVQNVYVV